MGNEYKKRAKGSWNVGKGCKDSSNVEERQFEQIEIKQALEQTDPSFRVKKGKRKRNKRASLEHTLKWYEQQVMEQERDGKHPRGHSWTCMMRDGVERTKKELEELEE